MAAADTPSTTYRVVDWQSLCNNVDDKMQEPEVVYRFSNGAEKKSTDRTESGVYRR